MPAKLSDEAIEWFSKLHSGQATPEDRAHFEIWRGQSPAHAAAYAEVEKLWGLLDRPAHKVFARESPKMRPKPRATRTPARWLLAGCSLIVGVMLLGGWDWVRFWNSDYHTGWGEQREFSLADGSRIALNTHSALTVGFSPERREIQLLEGEAYFQVTRDTARPFVVVTAHGRVEVTGTAFYVREQAEWMTVTVAQGRVRVHAQDAQRPPVELTAHHQVDSDARGLGAVQRVDIRQVSAWRDHLLIFEMRPLAAVVEELNRYLPGRIVIANPRLRERIVSGAFDLTQPGDALAAIEHTLKLDAAHLSNALILLY